MCGTRWSGSPSSEGLTSERQEMSDGVSLLRAERAELEAANREIIERGTKVHYTVWEKVVPS